MFSHQNHQIRTEFVEILTGSGTKFLASPDHYIWVHADNNATEDPISIKAKLVKACDVRLGHKLLQTTPTQITPIRALVVRISRSTRQGLFNPHTSSGTIVVDDILASTFTSTLPPSLTLHSVITSPALVLYKILNFIGAVPLANTFNSGLLYAYFNLGTSFAEASSL